MHDSEAVPSPDGASVIGYTGIYNADGGLAGEFRYLLGHLFGSAECSLCDITHSTVRRKSEWNALVARMTVPLTVLHRNEIDESLSTAVRGIPLPVVVAHRADGSTSVVLTAEQLAQLRGSVAEFERALLATRGPS